MNKDGSPPSSSPVRALKPMTSRVMLTVLILIALGISYLAAEMILASAQDPVIQERFEEIRRLQRGEAPLPVDSAAVDTTRG